jgi:hypothetical protein
MGLRRARAQAQRELNDQADRFENVIAEIHAEMRGVRDELAFLLTNEALDMGLINRIESFYGLLNLRVR